MSKSPKIKVKASQLLNAFKSDLEEAKKSRSELDIKIAQWKREYNGEPYGNENPDKSQIVSRDIKRQSSWQHASLVAPFVTGDNIIKAKPVTWEDRDVAVQSELVLNNQFCRQFPRYNFMTKAVKVLDQEGTVVIQTAWEYEDEEYEYEVELLDENDNVTSTELRTEIKIKKNKPTAKVLRNEDVYIDPTCEDDMDRCQFVIVRYESDLSTLRTDGRYSNLDKIKHGESAYGDLDYTPEDETYFKFSDDPRKKLVVYEYWGYYDVNGDGINESVVCTWVNDVVIQLEENPYPHGKLPFIVVPFNSTPFKLYGESNAEYLSDAQKVKTAILRGFIDNMAQANNGQKGIPVGALDYLNKQRFLKGYNYEYRPQAGVIQEHGFNQIPGSAFDVFRLMSNEIESLTATKAFSEGLSGTSLGGTATGVRGALDAQSTRRLDMIINIAENLVKPLLYRWMEYNAVFLEEVEVIRMTNDEFVPIRRDDLNGSIDIILNVSTREDDDARASQLAFLLQTVAPNEDPAIKKLLLSEYLRLVDLPDAAKIVKEYEPQPDPMAQYFQQLQLKKLEAEVFNEQAKGQENAVDVDLKRAKTQSELAKAGKLNEEADITSLKFLQDSRGVGHQQALELKDMDRLSKLDIEAQKALVSKSFNNKE